MKDNEQGTTHYEVPVNITDREIEAIQAMIDNYFIDEYKGCQQWRDLNNEKGDKVAPDGWKDGDHIYYDLKVLQGLIDKINKR